MKKNKKLDKIIAKAVESSIKNGSIDQTKAAQYMKNFKTLSLEESLYALKMFQKGLQNFINKHTLVISAPVDLPKETLNKITKSLYTLNAIRYTQFNLDSSLLAGFKFKIGDEVFDNSLRSTLESLKTK